MNGGWGAAGTFGRWSTELWPIQEGNGLGEHAPHWHTGIVESKLCAAAAASKKEEDSLE